MREKKTFTRPGQASLRESVALFAWMCVCCSFASCQQPQKRQRWTDKWSILPLASPSASAWVCVCVCAKARKNHRQKIKIITNSEPKKKEKKKPKPETISVKSFNADFIQQRNSWAMNMASQQSTTLTHWHISADSLTRQAPTQN